VRSVKALRVGRSEVSSSSVSMYSGQLAKSTLRSRSESSRRARSPGFTYAAGTPHPVSAAPAAKPNSRDRRDMGFIRIAGTSEEWRAGGTRSNGRCVDRYVLRATTLSIMDMCLYLLDTCPIT
jgi:hypothetical protein